VYKTTVDVICVQDATYEQIDCQKYINHLLISRKISLIYTTLITGLQENGKIWAKHRLVFLKKCLAEKKTERRENDTRDSRPVTSER
jgi:hypothetical protein